MSRAARWFLVASLGLALASGCSNQETPTKPDRQTERMPTTASANSRRPVDADLIAFLSKARAAHHAADLAESKNDLQLAIQHVEKIAYGPMPATTPEVIEVRADAHARLADLKSRVGLFEEALREVDKGLELAKETTHFRGHLFEVKGLVHERKMKSQQGKNDAEGAEKSRLAALEAFETAIAVQDEVITKMLPDPVPAGASGIPANAPPAPSPAIP